VPRVYLLLHSNGDLRNSTVAGWLSMFATCGRFPWKAPTFPPPLAEIDACCCEVIFSKSTEASCKDAAL
jgi:hypothetical protein